jgi:hypothetical protein
MRPNSAVVYVSSDAILCPSDKPDPVLETGISTYAKPFMYWCSGLYTTILLTDLPAAHAKYLLNRLGLREDQVLIRFYHGAKTDSIRPEKNIYMIDDALIPSEVSWFLEHGLQDHIIGVDPHTGVSPATRQALEERIRHGK